jgi:hypothetical protein
MKDNNATSLPASQVSKDAAKARAPNPRMHFQSPEILVNDQTLNDEEKYTLLCEWDLELSNRLKAEEEGMSASDPIRSRHEAKLADEAARVKSNLTELGLKLGYG